MSPTDQGVSSKASTPSSVEGFDAAVRSFGSGRFIEDALNPTARPFLACIYGGPFYALANLAPEVFSKGSVDIVLGGSLPLVADEGGRWLSLYRRASTYTGRISCTICETSKPTYGRAPRQLLTQPPQKIVAKPWVRYLKEVPRPPDATVLYPPAFFAEYGAFLGDIALSEKAGVVLLGCRSRVEALVIRRLIPMYGMSASSLLGFADADGEVRARGPGAWWVAVRKADQQAAKVEEKELLQLAAIHRGLRDAIDSAVSFEDATAIATDYGRIVSVNVEDTVIPHAAMISDFGGVDLQTGRFFRRSYASDEEQIEGFRFDGATLAAEAVASAPRLMSGEPDLEAEYRVLAWLNSTSELLAGKGASAPDLSPNDEDEQIVPLPQTADDVAGRGPASVEDGKDTGPAQTLSTEAIHAASRDGAAGVPRLPVARSRLSRSAGTVNVLAIAARLGNGVDDSTDVIAAARTRILKWLSNKGFGEAVEGLAYHFESPDGEVSIETDGDLVWAVRFDDRKQMVGGAFWRVEIALVRAKPPAIGLRLYQVRRSDDAPPPVTGVPKVLASIASEVGISDYGIPLVPTALRLRGVSGAEALLRMLLNSNRVHPVIVVATGRGVVPEPSVDRLAERLVGAAHVVVIDDTIADRLISQFGRERAVFGGAVRLYRPGFSADADPFLQRLWTYSGSQFSPYLANDISEEVCAISLEAGDLEQRVPSFVAVRTQIGQSRLKLLRRQAEKVASTAEEERTRQVAIQRSLEIELEQVRAWAVELERRNEAVEKEVRTLTSERDEALEEVRRLRHRLNVQLEPEYGVVPGADTLWYPDSWDLLEEWVESYGEGRLVLLPSAVKAAQESMFHIELTYKALELLAKFYVPMRQRRSDDDEPYRRFNEELGKLGLECSPTGDATEQHRYKRQYQRTYEGRLITLDMHLKRGAGFDPEDVFRLYFFYDDDKGQVVIGHFPSHLVNSKTH